MSSSGDVARISTWMSSILHCTYSVLFFCSFSVEHVAEQHGFESPSAKQLLAKPCEKQNHDLLYFANLQKKTITQNIKNTNQCIHIHIAFWTNWPPSRWKRGWTGSRKQCLQWWENRRPPEPRQRCRKPLHFRSSVTANDIKHTRSGLGVALLRQLTYHTSQEVGHSSVTANYVTIEWRE